jgi:tetratricopeptide (TPR) repeat protein
LAAIGGTFAVMHWFVPSSPTTVWTNHFLPVFAGAYSMLHWRHLIDAANHLILLLPVSFLLIRKPRKTREKRQPFPWATVLLWGPTVFALVTFNPKLGWWRDWDLFALLSAPALVVLSVAVAQRQHTWSLPRRVAAISVAVVSLSLWTWVNVDEDASVARFESLLLLDPDRALSGYENLGRYWREKGDWEQSVRVLGTALAMKGHERLFTQRGIGFSALRMPDSGLVAFQNAIAADTTEADGYFGCGQMLWLLNRSGEALPYLQKAVAMDSSRVQYRYQLGEVLRDAGEYEAALPHFAYASATVTSQPVYANMYAATLFDAGEADSAMTILLTIINRHPAFGMAYSNLAWIRYQQGDIPGAEAALNEYERRTRPDERVAPTSVLRRAIDSIHAAGPTDSE